VIACIVKKCDRRQYSFSFSNVNRVFLEATEEEMALHVQMTMQVRRPA
jgi:hypothetical protein